MKEFFLFFFFFFSTIFKVEDFDWDQNWQILFDLTKNNTL